MPRKEYQPRKKGQSSSSSNIVEAQESDSQDTIMLEDWDNSFRPGTSTPAVVELAFDSNSDAD